MLKLLPGLEVLFNEADLSLVRQLAGHTFSSINEWVTSPRIELVHDLALIEQEIEHASGDVLSYLCGNMAQLTEAVEEVKGECAAGEAAAREVNAYFGLSSPSTDNHVFVKMVELNESVARRA